MQAAVTAAAVATAAIWATRARRPPGSMVTTAPTSNGTTTDSTGSRLTVAQPRMSPTSEGSMLPVRL